MNPQGELFHEDWRDALRHLIKSLGGYEVVGADLFPAKTRKAAGNWLSDCINPERSAKLDLEEVVMLHTLGRKSGVMCAHEQFCKEQDGRFQLVAPRSEKSKLLERQQHAIEAARLIQEDIDRIDAAETLRAVNS